MTSMPPNVEQYLTLLHRALVMIRFACQGGETERAEAIADAVHTLPLALLRPDELRFFDQLYLSPLIKKYPDLEELAEYVRTRC